MPSFIDVLWSGGPVVKCRTANPEVRGSNPGRLEISEMLLKCLPPTRRREKLSVMLKMPESSQNTALTCVTIGHNEPE